MALEQKIKNSEVRPDLEEMKKAKKPLVKLIGFYINLRYGMSRERYLIKKRSSTIRKNKLNNTVVRSWFYDKPFPLRYLKGFVNELKIPIEEVIEINNRKNPFKPDLEEYEGNIGKLIGFYINLRYRGLLSYLKKSRIVRENKLNVGSVKNWFGSRYAFPLKYLKGFVDELQIPYKEVNYLIKGDIEKGIAKSGDISVEPTKEMILNSVKLYIEKYNKGMEERPKSFYKKHHHEFEENYGVSTKEIYQKLNREIK